MKKKADFTISFLCVIGIFSILGINGCQQTDGPALDDENVSKKSSEVQLKTAQTSDEFEQDLKSYFNAMLESQTAPHFYGAVNDEKNIAVADMATETSTVLDSSVNLLSATNLIEQGVDESDLVKSDGDYLYIARQVQYQSRYFADDRLVVLEVAAAETVIADDSGTEVSARPPYDDRPQKISPAGVRIMKLDNGTPKATEIAEIEFADNVSQVLGLYLPNKQSTVDVKTLYVVANVNKPAKDNIYQFNNIRISAYNITDPSTPSLIWDFEVEGYYHASRSLNGKIYLVSSKYLWLEGLDIQSSSAQVKVNNTQLIADLQIEDLLPTTWVNGSKNSIVKATDCVIPNKTSPQTVFGASLLSVLTIPLNNPEKTQALCTLESSNEVYVSPKAIYFTKGEYAANGDRHGQYYTVIHKLVFTDDSVAYQSSGRVKGWTGWRSNSFRMSELNDDLRVVVTDYEMSKSNDLLANEQEGLSNPNVDNANDDMATIEPDFRVWRPTEPVHRLYVLREDATEKNRLAVLSTLPNEALPKKIGKPGEDIYAVRFFADYAYIVTYRNVDPLYVLNLKDPTAPFIEGELSIPGYSDYLHPLNGNLLLGVGQDAVVENNTAWVQGVKMGLFDVSDKTNPIEVGGLQIGKRGTSTALSYDHRAFSIITDTESGVHRIALPVNVHETEAPHKRRGDNAWEWFKWTYAGLQLIEIDDGTVSSNVAMSNAGVLQAVIASDDQNYYYPKQPRTVLADKAVHYIEGQDVWSAAWESPESVLGPQ